MDEAEGIVRVADIDAFDGTKIIDLKAYFPAYDRVREVRVADWSADWPEWLPEDSLGFLKNLTTHRRYAIV